MKLKTAVTSLFITMLFSAAATAAPPDLSQITDSDRAIFATIFTPEQVQELQGCGNLPNFEKTPGTCYQMITVVGGCFEMFGKLIEKLDPVLDGKQLSAYSTDYMRENVDNFKKAQVSLKPIMDDLKKDCAAGEPSAAEVDYGNRLVRWFTDSKECVSCQKYAIGTVDRDLAGPVEYNTARKDPKRYADLSAKFERYLQQKSK